jgi:sugar O-acyltransferase (sialic acid O-acetyltransferase NeuD family)
MSKGLLVMGIGGHARSVGDVALACGFDDLLFVAAAARPGERVLGFASVQVAPAALAQGWQCFPSAGDADARAEQFEDAQRCGWSIATLVSPLATLRTGARAEAGAFIAHHAHLGPEVHVGRGTIVNTGAIVDHESSTGHFSHVSINASVAGRVKIGSFCCIGAGASVIDQLSICDRVIIGAGATVIHTIDAAGTWVGVPARKVR